MTRLSWEPIVERAAVIVGSYDTGVTLRQLFYRLVAAEVLPNTQVAYRTLSRYTAEARRARAFPALIDQARRIHREPSFSGVEHARSFLHDIYRRDRTENQDVSIYLGVEKAGIVEQLQMWFGDDLGIPVLSLGGYSSQSYVDVVVRDAFSQNREAVLIYAGDFDASGEDIDRDFLQRTGCFDTVVRVALNASQVDEYQLPPQPGKAMDPRAKAFTERHGLLVQVELDALPPDDLRRLYQAAIDEYWDTSQYEAVIEQEDAERAELKVHP